MIVRTEVQSDKAKGKVAKVSHQASGSFRNLKFIRRGSCIFQRHGRPLNLELLVNLSIEHIHVVLICLAIQLLTH